MIQLAARFRTVLTVALLALCAGTFAQAASECPFNGGFDVTNLSVPVGWTIQGKWLLRSEASYGSKNGILVRPDLVNVGDRLITDGYVLAGPGETLNLSLHYTSRDGGPGIGLIFCDAFGRAVGEGLVESLPPADTWTTHERSITLTAEACPVPYAAVRPFFIIERAGVQAKLDGLTLTREHAETPAPLLPNVKIEQRPNLLTNPTMRRADDGTMIGWSALDCGGYSANSAVVMPITDSASGTLALMGTDQAAAWLSEPTAVDVSLPYTVRAEVSTADLNKSQAVLLVRVIDPVDAGSIWMQYTVSAEATKGPTQFRVNLPRLTVTPSPGRVQIALLLDAGGEGAATMAAVALEPEPLTLTVRASPNTDFKRTKDVNLFVTAINNAACEIQPKACIKVIDSDGKQVAYQEPKLVAVPSRNAAFFPYKPKLPGAGEYKMLVTICSAGRELASSELVFRVLGE